MKNHRSTPIITLFVLFVTSHPARADFLYGIDSGSGPASARPNTDEAVASYTSATAGMQTRLITFEGVSNGGRAGLQSTSIALGQGITLESNQLDALPPPGFQYGLTNIPNASAVQSNARLGYNISGSSRFTVVPVLNTGTASVLFRSTTAFNSFGFYLTGLGNQTGQVEVILDGINPYRIAGAADGGVLFVGYLGSPEVEFRTLELRLTGINGPNRDVFAIDDIRFTLVPEPAAFMTLGTGLAIVLGFGHSRRRRRQP